jgi:oligosaccharide repeat unit polymerase
VPLNLQYHHKKQNFLILALQRPSFTMVATWLGWLFLYILPFFEYTKPISLYTSIIIFLFIFSFCLGDLSLTQFLGMSHKKLNYKKRTGNSLPQKPWEFGEHPVQRKVFSKTIRWFSIVGLAGALAFVFGKLFLSEIDFSTGISNARIERATSAVLGESAKTPLIVYLGFLTFPFGTSAFLIHLLYSAPLSKWTNRLAKLSIIAPISVAVINGGRGGILHLFIMGGATLFLNKIKGIKLSTIWRKLGIIPYIFITGFLFYSAYIFESRRLLVGKENFLTLFSDWEANYYIAPAQWLLDIIENNFLDGNFAATIMQTYYYLSSGPSIFGIILDSQMQLNYGFGQYQIPLITSFLERFIPSLSLRSNLYSSLDSIDTLGLLPSAWGMFYVDFGLWGGFLEAFLWGALSSLIYINASKAKKMSLQLTFCFMVASIVLSPLVAPLGFSETFFTLLAFLISDLIIHRKNSNFLKRLNQKL